MTPWSLFLSRGGLRAALKNVLGFVFLQSIWHKFNIRFEMGVLNSLELEIIVNAGPREGLRKKGRKLKGNKEKNL